jgi:hypothetical protein
MYNGSWLLSLTKNKFYPSSYDELAKVEPIPKKITVQDFTIEKRWIKGNAKIELSIKYEVHVNDKKLGSKSAIESILTLNSSTFSAS